MRVAVFGSSVTASELQHPIHDPTGIDSFCRSLGKSLAALPHSILVESDSDGTADRMIVEGILSAERAPGAKVVVYHRIDHHLFEQRTSRPFGHHVLQSAFRYVPLPQQYVGPAHLWMLQDADVVIVIGGGKNAYAAGLAAAFMGRRLIPVGSFGGAGQQLWLDFDGAKAPPAMRFPRPSTWSELAGHRSRVAAVVLDELASLPRIMIVHGRTGDREVVKEILAAHQVPDPLILQEEFDPGDTIPEKFERAASQADAAIALFTPDDHGALAVDDADALPEQVWRARARQNVSLECGWFWGRLGRNRVLLLLKGDLELPSDLAGIVYEQYSESPVECKQVICRFVTSIRSPDGPSGS